jgi:hypothetical protein
MKKYILIFALLGLIFNSCDKDFLEPVNYGSALSSDYFSDESRLDMITLGVYKQLQATGDYSAKGLYGYSMWAFADGAADLVNTRGQQWDSNINPFDLQNGVQTPGSAIFSQLWSRNYAAIRRANDVVDNASKVPAEKFKAMKVENYIGEAKFIRALGYFNLIRVFGGRPHVTSENEWGVPLIVKAVDSPEGLILPRNAVSEVYQQIIDDLVSAGESLPSKWPATLHTNQTKGRAVAASAWGLLAKVYMTIAGTSGNAADWNKAAEYAKKVMDLTDPKYDLFSTSKAPFAGNSYANLFRIDGGGENSIESLFEIQSVNISEYGFGDNYNNFISCNTNFVQNTKGNVHPTKEFVETFYETGDLRRDASIFVPGDKFYPDKSTTPFKIGGVDWVYPTASGPKPSGHRNSTTGYSVKKFLSGTVVMDTWETGPANPRVLRFSEMLLIRAEALNELQGPGSEVFALINRVRSRAGLPDLDPSLNKEQVRAAIWKERAVELFMEADRWFDLKRTDRLISRMIVNNQTFSASNVINWTSSQKHYIMPIPRGEINLTVQNGTPVLKQAPEYQ